MHHNVKHFPASLMSFLLRLLVACIAIFSWPSTAASPVKLSLFVTNGTASPLHSDLLPKVTVNMTGQGDNTSVIFEWTVDSGRLHKSILSNDKIQSYRAADGTVVLTMAPSVADDYPVVVTASTYDPLSHTVEKLHCQHGCRRPAMPCAPCRVPVESASHIIHTNPSDWASLYTALINETTARGA